MANQLMVLYRSGGILPHASAAHPAKMTPKNEPAPNILTTAPLIEGVKGANFVRKRWCDIVVDITPESIP